MVLISSTQIGLRLETHWPVLLQLAPIHMILTIKELAGRTHKCTEIENANDG